MLRGIFKGMPKSPILFEDVVYGLLTRVKNCSWRICKPHGEEDFEFNIHAGEEVTKHKETEAAGKYGARCSLLPCQSKL